MQTLKLTADRWTQLRQVQDEVNALPYRTDAERWGRPEYWEAITAAGGDCEDYALGKRNRLRALGWPDAALRLAVCKDETGVGHGVLTVETDLGTYVLDNRFAEVMPWAALTAYGYRWISRQAVDGPGWVAIAA